MLVVSTPSFNKDLSKLKNKQTARKIELILNKMENAKSITEISGIKKLAGSTNAYRIRIGDYRLGFFVLNTTIRLTILAHRKEVYRYFP